ncbi:MAG: IclR family transcriptional regulator domain-containing protein, partial [Ilumatobacteraceae bacterium]
DLVLKHGMNRRAPRTITSKALLVEALDRIRTLGYSVSVEESEPGVASVGAPVFGRDGSCIAAVAMAGPALRLGDEQLLRSVRQVRRCAAEISEAMGYRERRSRGA